MLLNLAMRRAAKLYPDNTATIFHHERRSCRNLMPGFMRWLLALIEMGLKPGDKAAIYILNSPHFLEVTYACFEAGIVIVPLNTRLAAEEPVFIINDAECSAFITDDILQPLASAFKPGIKGVRHYISVNGAGEFIDYEQTLAKFAGHRTELSEVANGSDEVLAGLFYTSGTTGMPKGVMLSHRNLWMNAPHTIAARPAEPKQVFLYAAPMFYLRHFPPSSM
ncbi:MAG: AMP-binding protein [Acidobacteria bacterium]|nr:AMP-binding protein [Acidobacteriota bacterium]